MPLAILMYHAFDGSGSPVSIEPKTFERQLSRLHAAGFTVLPLTEALSHLNSSTEPLAALTFDDAYSSVADVAAPLLAHIGWRATVFAISRYLGRDNQWPGQPTYVPRAPLMTWTQLDALAARGWEVGAHTRTHPDLTALDSDQQIEDEVAGSKHDLEEHFGGSVSTFAYPSGRYDERVRAVVRRHFSAAVTTEMGWASLASPPDALERIEMWDFSRPGTYRLLGTPLMGAYLSACRALRKFTIR